jgi:hypothetical protein
MEMRHEEAHHYGREEWRIARGAGSVYAQTRERFEEPGAPASAAPAYADDSCETGKYGPPVRVEPGDVVENGEIVARDPDPNIRTQLEREYSPGGYNEC